MIFQSTASTASLDWSPIQMLSQWNWLACSLRWLEPVWIFQSPCLPYFYAGILPKESWCCFNCRRNIMPHYTALLKKSQFNLKETQNIFVKIFNSTINMCQFHETVPFNLYIHLAKVLNVSFQHDAWRMLRGPLWQLQIRRQHLPNSHIEPCKHHTCSISLKEDIIL